jgi:autotransporter family porin
MITDNIVNAFVGTSPISAIYAGNTLVWPCNFINVTAPATVSTLYTGKYGLNIGGTGSYVVTNTSNTYRCGTNILSGVTLTVSGSSTSFTSTGTLTAGPLGIGTLTMSNSSGLSGTHGITTTLYNKINIPTGNTVNFYTGGNTNSVFIVAGNLYGGGTINHIVPNGLPASSYPNLYLSGNNSSFTGVFSSSNISYSRLKFTSLNAGSSAARWVFNNSDRTNNTNEDSVGFAFNTGTTGTIRLGTLEGTGSLRGDTTNGNITLAVGEYNTNFIFKGLLSNKGARLSLLKVGTSTMTISSNNNYIGGTTVASGTLSAASGYSTAFGTGTIFVSAGAYLFQGSTTNTVSAAPGAIVNGALII